jgi:hypothetical protein
MSNFENSDPDHSSHFSTQSGIIKKEVEARWGDDMNGATSMELEGLFKEKITNLTVTEFDMAEEGASVITVDLKNESPYKSNERIDSNDSGDSGDTGFINSILSRVQGIIGQMADFVYGWFNFNTEGFVKSEVSVKLKFNRKAPIYGGGEMLLNAIPALTAQEALVVDAWDLKDGSDVDWGQDGAAPGGKNEGYYRQVDKLMFGGFKYMLTDWMGSVGDFIKDLASFLGIRLPYETTVRSYALRNVTNYGTAGCPAATDQNPSQRNIKGCIEFKNVADPPGAKTRKAYYTNVFTDDPTFANGIYFKVYKNQSPQGGIEDSGYYMGCNKPEIVDRQECW